MHNRILPCGRGAVVWLLCVLIGIPSRPVAGQAVPADSLDQLRDSLRAVPLPPIVVTGTRVPLRRDRLPFAADVLDEATLAREPAHFALEALRRLTAISIDEGAGVGGPSVLRLRGGDEPFTQVMFDGVPINLTGGFLDLQGLTLVNVDRVEVMRGPQSAIYGSSAMAGAVQFITRRGRPGPLRWRASAEGGLSAGPSNQGRAEASIDGGSERVRYSVGAGGAFFRGIYELPHDLNTWDAAARIDWDLTPALTLEGITRVMDVSSNLPVRNPGVTRAPLDPNQRDRRTRWLSSVGVSFDPSDGWRHDLDVRLFRDDFTYEDMTDGLDPSDYPFFVPDFTLALNSVLDRGAVEYTGAVDLGAGEAATLAYGAKVEREDLDVGQTGDFGDSDSHYDRDNRALFAEVQGRMGSRVDFLGGMRLETFEGLPTEWLPRAGLTLAVIPDLFSLRIAGGRAFKAPNLQQQYLENPFTVPNPDLEPEVSSSWEAGANVTVPATGLETRVTLFRQSYDNLIRLVPVASGRSQNQNLGESRVLGLEAEVNKSFGTGWSASVGAAWLDSELLDNRGLSGELYPVGSSLVGVPRWTANATVDGEIMSGLGVTLRGRFVGEKEAFTERFSGARIGLDPYFLVGATLRARMGAWPETYLRVENLLDASYSTAYDRPGMPFTAFLGVRISG